MRMGRMAADCLPSSFEAHLQRFIDYTDSFSDVPDAAPLRLKVEHTLKVFEHARCIIDSLGDSISPELGRAPRCRIPGKRAPILPAGRRMPLRPG